MDTPEIQPVGSRRSKLWELQHRYHCPIVGVCFKLGEVRELVCKLMRFPKRPSDYEVHCTATSECSSRTPLSSLLHKTLDKKYALAIQRCKTAKTDKELEQRWHACIGGNDVPGMLWAVLTHPVCGEELRIKVYGDIHMLQHQIGAGVRHEQEAWKRLQEENAILGRELARIQQRVSESSQRYIEQLADYKTQLESARAEIARLEALAARHAAERDQLRQQLDDTGEHTRLMYRLQLTESAYTTLKARHSALESEHSTTLEENRRLEQQLQQLLADSVHEAQTQPLSPSRLQGRTILCVGGRMDTMPHFKSLVQMRGGEFIYHDGGKEESINRLEAVISAADTVICQTGCISHNAYWRVKEQCKRTGKSCTFVGTPSLSSFLHVLDDIAQQGAEIAENSEN